MTQPTDIPTKPPDKWAVWFSRLIQMCGLASFIYEVLTEHAGHDRPWVLLLSVAMMLGGFGLQMVLRYFLAAGRGPGGE